MCASLLSYASSCAFWIKFSQNFVLLKLDLYNSAKYSLDIKFRKKIPISWFDCQDYTLEI